MAFDKRQFVRVMRRMAEAVGYLELGLSEPALRTLQAVGDAGPFEASVAMLRGEAHRLARDYPAAVASLSNAAQHIAAPHNRQAWLALSWCLRQAGQMDRAIDSLGRARGASFPTPWLPSE